MKLSESVDIRGLAKDALICEDSFFERSSVLIQKSWTNCLMSFLSCFFLQKISLHFGQYQLDKWHIEKVVWTNWNN